MLNTKIEFLKVPYTVDGAHQYIPNANTNSSASIQENFFRSNFYQSSITNRVLVDPNDGVVLVRGKYSTLSKSNYMMFKNPSYGNKMFYAYIVDLVPRAGDETVEVHYVIDSVQSYLFEWYGSLNEGLVFREHINHDNPKWIEPTLLEDLPTGKLETTRVYSDIKNKSKYEEDFAKQNIMWAVFISTKSHIHLVERPETTLEAIMDSNSNSLAQTLFYYAIPFSVNLYKSRANVLLNGARPLLIQEMSDFFSSSEKAVNSLVKVIIKNDLPMKDIMVKGTITSDVSIPEKYLTSLTPRGPKFVKFNVDNEDLDTDGTVLVQTDNIFNGIHEDNYRLRYPPFTRYYIETDDGVEKEFDITKLPGPEVILKYRTNMGPLDSSILHIEGFNSKQYPSNEHLQYELSTPFASSKSIPVVTNQLASLVQSQENQMQASKHNAYAQGAVQVVSTGVSLNNSLGSIGSGIAKGSGGSVSQTGLSTFVAAGAVGAAAVGTGLVAAPALAAAAAATAAVGLLSAVANVNAERLSREATLNDAKNIPNSVGNLGSDISYNILNKRSRNVIKVKTVSDMYKDIAIDNFNKNGYNIMRNKIPAIRTRTGYNYIQCGLNIGGASIPQSHINNIKEKFLHGVTFWHNADVYNYSQSNGSIASSYHG